MAESWRRAMQHTPYSMILLVYSFLVI